MTDRVLSYREMCDAEGMQTLQRGMNFHINRRYSIVLMSQRLNAPYKDRILPDGVTLLYEGHDEPRTSSQLNPKKLDQPSCTAGGKLTQNGLFARAIDRYKQDGGMPELVKVYEKLWPGLWSFKGFFDLHFDHDLPYSKGGASITVRNIRLLCAKCNLAKSDKIE